MTASPPTDRHRIPASTAGRRERKKAATRRALETAALALVAERGFDHVTVADIADAADVSKRTFFNYFTSKEQAILGGDPGAPEAIRRALTDRPGNEPPLRALESVLGMLAHEYTGTRPDWLARRQVIRSDPHLLAASVAGWGELERTLVEVTAQRLGVDPEQSLYPAVLVSASISAVRMATLRWGVGDQSLDTLVAEAFDALATGLAAPPPGASHRPASAGGPGRRPRA